MFRFLFFRQWRVFVLDRSYIFIQEWIELTCYIECVSSVEEIYSFCTHSNNTREYSKIGKKQDEYYIDEVCVKFLPFAGEYIYIYIYIYERLSEAEYIA